MLSSRVSALGAPQTDGGGAAHTSQTQHAKKPNPSTGVGYRYVKMTRFPRGKTTASSSGPHHTGSPCRHFPWEILLPCRCLPLCAGFGPSLRQDPLFLGVALFPRAGCPINPPIAPKRGERVPHCPGDCLGFFFKTGIDNRTSSTGVLEPVSRYSGTGTEVPCRQGEQASRTGVSPVAPRGCPYCPAYCPIDPGVFVNYSLSRRTCFADPNGQYPATQPCLRPLSWRCEAVL